MLLLFALLLVKKNTNSHPLTNWHSYTVFLYEPIISFMINRFLVEVVKNLIIGWIKTRMES